MAWLEEDILFYFRFKHSTLFCSPFQDQVAFEAAIPRFKSGSYKFEMAIHMFRPAIQHRTETATHTFKWTTKSGESLSRYSRYDDSL